MKPIQRVGLDRLTQTAILGVLLLSGLGVNLAQAAAPEATNASPIRIGVYDSRPIAYAHFWSAPEQQKIKAMTKAAADAKSAGDKTRFKELDKSLKAQQELNHLRVFSTAPIDDVLASMPERIAAIKREAGVLQLISKWDEKALAQFPGAERIDVTDLLLGEFKLDAKQRKVAADLRSKAPLPLPEAQRLARQGRL